MAATNEEIAVRSHDVIVSSGSSRASEFEALTTMGAAVRLAVNLRGVATVSYQILRDVSVHRLGLLPAEVRPAVELLAEAEMVLLLQEGRTIRTVIPQIPFYGDLYDHVGAVGVTGGLNEHEQLTITLMERLHQGPVTKDQLAALGAEKESLGRVLRIGKEAGFVVPQRARGQDVFISPGYFSEDPKALADLTVLAGGGRLARVLTILKSNQGYPLAKIRADAELGGYTLDAKDLAVMEALAGDGFIPPPAIEASHSGRNYFMFGPRPGETRLLPRDVQIYRNALALVAAVRQGQCLSKNYAIRNPKLLLERLKDRGKLGSNSEALEQYRYVAQAGVAVLIDEGGGRASLQLVENPDNRRTLEMAIEMVSGEQSQAAPDEELILALRRGEQYVEPLLARKDLKGFNIVGPDPEVREVIECFMLRGVR